MKIRNLLAVVAMISVLIFGIGTAYAVTGVADDVPGQDIVFPIICEGSQNPVRNGAPIFGTLNTIWAIADKDQSGVECSPSDSVCDPHPGSKHTIGVVDADVFVKTVRSEQVLDGSECWSLLDVISDNCQDLVNQVSWSDQAKLVQNIGGIDYFVGYVIYSQRDTCGETSTTNRFLSWVYLNDISKGFSAGFNGVSMEDGTIPDANAGLAEDSDIGITAHTMFPRYFILNGSAETWNWWIFLLGRNEYQFGPNHQNEFDRELNCFWCDEQEHCLSKNVAIPDELNIIDVAGELPGGIFAPGTFPKAGFATCDISETGFLPGNSVQTAITGTLSFTDDNDGTTETDPEAYTILGWSYQRALPVSNNQKLSVVHPVHRTYCARGSGGIHQPRGTCDGDHNDQSYPEGVDDLPYRFSTCEPNVDFCSLTGPIPDYTQMPSD